MKKKFYKKKNSRKITARLPKKSDKVIVETKKKVLKTAGELYPSTHFPRFILSFLVAVAILLAVLVVVSYVSYQTAAESKQRVVDNYIYWSEVAENHPNSPDAYYNAGKYAYELNKLNEAVELLDHAIELDPGFEKAILLQEKIIE